MSSYRSVSPFWRKLSGAFGFSERNLQRTPDVTCFPDGGKMPCITTEVYHVSLQENKVPTAWSGSVDKPETQEKLSANGLSRGCPPPETRTSI